MVVSGPTLTAAYSDHWGNVVSSSHLPCAGFSLGSAKDVTVAAVSAEAPLELVDCTARDTRDALPALCFAAGIIFAAEGR